MPENVPYIISAIRTREKDGRHFLSIWLQLKDNSVHRIIKVGGIQIIDSKGNIDERPVCSNRSTFIVAYVGGSDKHRQTEYSFEITERSFQLLQKQAIMKFSVFAPCEPSGEKRYREEIIVKNGTYMPNLTISQ